MLRTWLLRLPKGCANIAAKARMSRRGNDFRDFRTLTGFRPFGECFCAAARAWQTGAALRSVTL